MVLEGGVAGAQPLHKGGRLRPTAQKQGMRREKSPSLVHSWKSAWPRKRTKWYMHYRVATWAQH